MGEAQTVEKENGEYVAYDRNSEEIARAGALNFKDSRLAFGEGEHIAFPESPVQVDKLMHSDGVLFVE